MSIGNIPPFNPMNQIHGFGDSMPKNLGELIQSFANNFFQTTLNPNIDMGSDTILGMLSVFNDFLYDLGSPPDLYNDISNIVTNLSLSSNPTAVINAGKTQFENDFQNESKYLNTPISINLSSSRLSSLISTLAFPDERTSGILQGIMCLPGLEGNQAIETAIGAMGQSNYGTAILAAEAEINKVWENLNSS